MQTRTALKRLSSGQIDVDRVLPNGPLAQNASWLLDAHNKREASIKAAQQRHEVAAAMPAIEAARTKLAEVLRDQVMPEDTPIVTRFDAFSVVKSASKQNQNDQSLRKMALHLERLWHKDPLGSLTVGALSRIRDHYQQMSPRSVVGEVVDTVIPKVSFKTLPVAKLVRIAASINGQEDYDIAVMQNGLQGNDPISVRARTFIRELVGRKEIGQIIENLPTETLPKRVTGGDVVDRIADKLIKDAAEGEDKNAAEECDKEGNVEAAQAKTKEGLGIEGTGMLQTASFLEEQADMYRCAAITGEALPKVAVAPPGWEGTVKKLTAEKITENPFALSWYMHGKGYEPGGTKKKSAKDEEKRTEGAEFEPEVNEQQDDQEKVSEDGGKALKSAVVASNPMVDDAMDHYPIHTAELVKLAVDSVKKLDKTPDWWLGSLKELVAAVDHGTKEAGKLPPALEKFKFNKGKGTKEPKKEDKKPKVAHSKEVVEQKILGGVTYRAAGLAIKVDSDDTISIVTPKGSKKYAMFDMDVAVNDFLYLVNTNKHPASTPPVPMFTIREGMRFVCPGCGNTNSYEMPKVAADLACGSCDAVVPAKTIAAAFNMGVAAEESVLVAYTPVDYQDEYGEKLVKAADIMGADSAGTSGCKAEIYGKNVSVEKLAEVWDYLVGVGFQPVAQASMPAPSIGTSPVPSMTAEEDMPPEALEPEGMEMEAPGPEAPGPEMELPGSEAPMMDSAEVPGGDSQWADEQVIQAAMMHYQHQGMDPIEAIVQFKKDYATEKKDEDGNATPGQEFDPMKVLQVTSEVFKTDLAQLQGQEYEMSALARKAQADIPTPKVNQQQPGAVQPEKLGPDSDNKDPGSYGAGKPKSQVKPQGNFADTGTEPDSDNRDPGDFKAETPKVQHPATDQAGTSLPATGLGQDSDTGDNAVTKKMETVSGQAPHNMRSAARGALDGLASFKKAAQDKGEVHELVTQAIRESKSNKKLSEYIESIALEWQGANSDILQQLLDKRVTADYLLGFSLAQMVTGRPDVYKTIKKMVSKEEQPEAPQAPAQAPAQSPAQAPVQSPAQAPAQAPAQ